MTQKRRVTDLDEEISPAAGDFLLLVKADGSAFKLDFANVGGGGGGSVAWSDVTGKPTAFPTNFSFCQVRNSNSGTNINGSASNIPFGGITDASSSDYTLSSNSITVGFSGTVSVHAHISQTAPSDIRTNVGVWITKNGAKFSGVGQSGYIRNGSGHDSASSHISATFAVSSGDVIRVQGEQRGSTGTVTQIAGESQVTVERRA